MVDWRTWLKESRKLEEPTLKERQVLSQDSLTDVESIEASDP